MAYQWESKKILIVEDEFSNYRIIEAVLMATKIQVLLARDGQTGVQLMRENPDVDIVLMDIQLPQLDGYNATREIREFNKEVPIIAVTAYALSSERDKSFEAGCNHYIAKPFRPKLLLEDIASFLENN